MRCRCPAGNQGTRRRERPAAAPKPSQSVFRRRTPQSSDRKRSCFQPLPQPRWCEATAEDAALLAQGGGRRGRHAPDRVAHIVGDEQRAFAVDRHADRPAKRIVVFDKAGQHVFGSPAGLPLANGTKITLYPLRGLRFQEPCCPMNAPLRNCSGSKVPSENVSSRPAPGGWRNRRSPPGERGIKRKARWRSRAWDTSFSGQFPMSNAALAGQFLTARLF